MNEQLVAFFYLLLRDEIVAGKVAMLVESSTQVRDPRRPIYSSKAIEAAARSLADEFKEQT